MARHFGKQSWYLIARLKLERYFQLLLLFVFAFGLGVIAQRIFQKMSLDAVSIVANLVAFVLTFCFLFGVFWYMYTWSRKEGKGFAKGIKGESSTYHVLKTLSNEYAVFQDVQFPKNGNIDFVVIGPNGAFAIEVKNISGNITAAQGKGNIVVNGREYTDNPVNQAYAQARLLETVLGIPVVPVLVLAGRTKIRFGMNTLKGVYVIGIDWVKKVITEYRGTLPDKQLQALEEILKEKTEA